MTKSPTTEPTTEVAVNSRKREYTAVAAATVVTVVLGSVAQHYIGKLASQVSDRIAPKPEPKTESTN